MFNYLVTIRLSSPALLGSSYFCTVSGVASRRAAAGKLKILVPQSGSKTTPEAPRIPLQFPDGLLPFFSSILHIGQLEIHLLSFPPGLPKTLSHGPDLGLRLEL